jgi:hypothetical protein
MTQSRNFYVSIFFYLGTILPSNLFSLINIEYLIKGFEELLIKCIDAEDLSFAYLLKSIKQVV